MISAAGPDPEYLIDDQDLTSREREKILASESGRETEIGVALSGGGIRSATFNLGVLEHLRKLGLLRRVGYLSTVSGGGYIGGWLAAGTLRDPHWTDADRPVGENWAASIAHLRNHSNYLSPRLGLGSADTWSMGMIWFRNTLVIQILVGLLIACVFCAPRVLGLLPPMPEEQGHLVWLLAAVIAAVTGALIYTELLRLNRYLANPLDPSSTARLWVPHVAAGGLLLLCCLIALEFFHAAARHSHQFDTVGEVARSAWLLPWSFWAFIVVVYMMKSAFAFIGVLTERKCSPWDRAQAPVAAVAGTACVLLLGMLLVVLTAQLSDVENAARIAPDTWVHWMVWALGPPALMAAFSLAIIIQIGVLGRALSDMHREWWSRLGAFLGMYSVAWMTLWGISVFGPHAVRWLGQQVSHWWTSGTLAAIVAAAVQLAQSSQTSKNGNASGTGERWTDRLTVALAALAVAGLLILVAAGVHQATVHLSGTPGTGYWTEIGSVALAPMFIFSVTLVLLLLYWSNRADINEFSLNQFYRHRLVRCYLGATHHRDRERREVQGFIGFRPDDDIALTALTPQTDSYRGPFPLINTAVNLGGSSDLEVKSRRAGAFLLSPLYSGSRRGNIRYQLTSELFSGCADMTLGAAVSISGAAASPNMGYHTAALPAFLMTIFNVRLGWWVPNPRSWKEGWFRRNFPLTNLVAELFGSATDKSPALDLSDGGHFENLGIYELLRRRCRLIIACDAEQDDELACGSLATLIRYAATDLNAHVEIDVSQIRDRDAAGMSAAHCAVGRIVYQEPDGERIEGTLIYLKSSLTGDEPTDVLQYKAEHGTFPHESTGDQFFSEAQFDSYRHLGRHIAETAFAPLELLERGGSAAVDRLALALRQAWTPKLTGESFTRHAAALTSLWRELREDPELMYLDEQFFPEWPRLIKDMEYAQANVWWASSASGNWLPRSADAFRKGFYFCNEVIQFMESVYVDLRLEQQYEHPDTRGWMSLFKHWSWSGMMRVAWAVTRATYGARFQTFCEERLGMKHSYEIQFEDGEAAQKLLNEWETAMLPKVRAACGLGAVTLRVLILKVTHPWDDTRFMPIPCGFALTQGNCLRFMRIQDHLRGAGLGSEVLDGLVTQGDTPCTEIAPVILGGDFKEWDASQFVVWVTRRHPSLKVRRS